MVKASKKSKGQGSEPAAVAVVVAACAKCHDPGNKLAFLHISKYMPATNLQFSSSGDAGIGTNCIPNRNFCTDNLNLLCRWVMG